MLDVDTFLTTLYVILDGMDSAAPEQRMRVSRFAAFTLK
jgi:hypothetical protein